MGQQRSVGRDRRPSFTLSERSCNRRATALYPASHVGRGARASPGCAGGGVIPPHASRLRRQRPHLARRVAGGAPHCTADARGNHHIQLGAGRPVCFALRRAQGCADSRPLIEDQASPPWRRRYAWGCAVHPRLTPYTTLCLPVCLSAGRVPDARAPSMQRADSPAASVRHRATGSRAVGH